jgi:hypothetical protein
MAQQTLQIPAGGVAPGGLTGQVLAKTAGADYAIGWANLSGDLNYVFTQVSPSATWVVVHNLGKYPGVNVVDSGGTMVIPDVHYDSLNQVTVSFGSATSGKAFVN